MKYKVIIGVFLLGCALATIGALFKLMHWPYASIILIFSLSIQAIAIALLAVKVLREKNFNNFLNK